MTSGPISDPVTMDDCIVTFDTTNAFLSYDSCYVWVQTPGIPLTPAVTARFGRMGRVGRRLQSTPTTPVTWPPQYRGALLALEDMEAYPVHYSRLRSSAFG